MLYVTWKFTSKYRGNIIRPFYSGFFCPKCNGFWPTDFTFLASSQLTLLLYWPCFCCHSFLVISCDCFEWKRFCVAFYCLLIFVLPLRIDRVIKRRGLRSNGVTPPHFCACHKPGPGFLASYVVVFLCSLREWERWLLVL